MQSGTESLASKLDLLPVAGSDMAKFVTQKSVPWSMSINAFAIHGRGAAKAPALSSRSARKPQREGRKLKAPNTTTDGAWKGVWQALFADEVVLLPWHEVSSLAAT